MRVFRRSADKRRGFTLVELLVAMSIFLVLSFITIGALRLGLTGEGVRTAARLVQSKLEGARDRAIYNSKETEGKPRPVGVRLLVDPNEPTICRSMVYIESAGYDESQNINDPVNGIFVLAEDVAGNTELVGTGTNWQTLYDRGLIGPGSKITVGRVGGSGTVKMTLHPDSFPLTAERLKTIEFHPDAVASPVIALEYSLELNPDVMADEDALELPQGVCIDLTNCDLPTGWGSGTGPFSNRMDIMFSAQGPCIGNAAAKGIIKLYLCDFEDALLDALPGDPLLAVDVNGDGNATNDQRAGNELGITIFTKAGRTIVHPIQLQSAGDPWQFGLEGEVAR